MNTYFLGLSPVALTCLGILAVMVIWLVYSSVRYIPNSRVGIVEKLFSTSGSVQSGLIALNDEAGFQPLDSYWNRSPGPMTQAGIKIE